MNNKIKIFHENLKNFIVNVLFKKFFIPAVLVFVYFFIVGPTSLIAQIFFRRKLTFDQHSPTSSWNKAEGYQPTLEESLKQS